MQQSITVYDISDLVELVAGLVRKGLTFEAKHDGASWVVKLTGGF